MDVTSLGLRTDLALLERSGSTIEDCGDHLLVRTPHNLAFYWGNFLVLDAVPAPGRIDAWLERFVEALPGARHRAIAFDCPEATVDDLAGFAERGFTVNASSVMTARSVQPPPSPHTEIGFAELGAETLVMVADPNDDAIRVYRTVGFTTTESALEAELAPPTT